MLRKPFPTNSQEATEEMAEVGKAIIVGFNPQIQYQLIQTRNKKVIHGYLLNKKIFSPYEL